MDTIDILQVPVAYRSASERGRDTLNRLLQLDNPTDIERKLIRFYQHARYRALEHFPASAVSQFLAMVDTMYKRVLEESGIGTFADSPFADYTAAELSELGVYEREFICFERFDIENSKQLPLLADYGHRCIAAILQNEQLLFTPRIEEAVIWYAGGGYSSANQLLRKTTLPCTTSTAVRQAYMAKYTEAVNIYALDDTFELFPETTNQLILWRGLSLSSKHRDDSSLLIKEDLWRGFSSTAASVHSAIGFLNMYDVDTLMLRIHVAPGVRLIPVTFLRNLYLLAFGQSNCRKAVLRLMNRKDSVAGVFTNKKDASGDEENELLLPRNLRVFMDWETLWWMKVDTASTKIGQYVRVLDVFVSAPI